MKCHSNGGGNGEEKKCLKGICNDYERAKQSKAKTRDKVARQAKRSRLF